MMAGDMRNFAGSIAELGENAAKITWANCLAYSENSPPLSTPDQISEARDYFREFGAWDDDEINAWTLNEVQAIVLQELAHQIKEFQRCDDYDDYRDQSERGSVSGMLYHGTDDRYYVAMGF
jgi:hypothetical protein